MQCYYLSLVQQLGCSNVVKVELIQTLWGGYGELVRLFVEGSSFESVIVKHVKLPEKSQHPRGWNTARSHQRKLKSYQVEIKWYRDYASGCPEYCYVPKGIYVEQSEQEFLLVLEDLSACGFPQLSKEATKPQLLACLRWLAYFHVKHIGHNGEGLWESGTYWHLSTRPDELQALEDKNLKGNAAKIDEKLDAVKFQTLVHGDAKLANFCFSHAGSNVAAAAVDFQYVGKGCAMKDVVLFISSAIEPEQCQLKEQWLLDHYFSYVDEAVVKLRPELNSCDIEAAWRPMFALAWADFQRFVKGWCPTHWKINPYTEALAKKALQELGS